MISRPCSLTLLVRSIDGHMNPVEWSLYPTQPRDFAVIVPGDRRK